MPNAPQSKRGSNPPPKPTPIQAAWIAYTDSVRRLLVPQPDDRSLDQYLEFRETVLALVQSPTFLDELQKSLGRPYVHYPLEIRNALIMELKAFSLSVEVAQATESATPESKGWWSKLLNRASTVTGSVKDFSESFPYIKGVLTLFKELIDLFRGGE